MLLEKVKDSNDIDEVHEAHGVDGHRLDLVIDERKYKKKKKAKKKKKTKKQTKKRNTYKMFPFMYGGFHYDHDADVSFDGGGDGGGGE
jgi:hypothetical protein